MKSESKSQKIERTILDADVVIVVDNIAKQIDSELGEIVKATQKVVANFIIRHRGHHLSPEELSLFLKENYDLVKALKQATNQAIKAKQNGSELELNEVLKLIQTPSVKSEMSFRKTRGRKKKTIATADTSAGEKPCEDLTIAVVDAVNTDVVPLISESVFKRNKPLTTPNSP